MGPDWKEKHIKDKRVSTVCGNHTNLLDHFTILHHPEAKYAAPRFTPGKICKNMPFFGFYIECFQGFYIDKADTQEEREKIVKDIGEE